MLLYVPRDRRGRGAQDVHIFFHIAPEICVLPPIEGALNYCAGDRRDLVISSSAVLWAKGRSQHGDIELLRSKTFFPRQNKPLLKATQTGTIVVYRQIQLSEKSTHKGVNYCAKEVTQTQQRPESPTASLTWHASKCKVHNKLHQRYIFKVNEICACLGAFLQKVGVSYSDWHQHCHK